MSEKNDDDAFVSSCSSGTHGTTKQYKSAYFGQKYDINYYPQQMEL